MNESHFQNLFDTLKDKDQQHMTPAFAEEFNKEVDSDGFIRSANSFCVAGDNSEEDCRIAFACLRRGDYPAVWLDVRTLLRRLDSKYIPRWTEGDTHDLDTADTIILSGVFDPNRAPSVESDQHGDLVWFIMDAIHNGVVVVIPTTTDTDLNLLGEPFGEWIENHFEVINVTQAKDKTKPAGKQPKHRRDATAVQRDRKHQRKNTKGD